MAHHQPKIIEDSQGMLFEYVDQDEAEFLYEVNPAVCSTDRSAGTVEGKNECPTAARGYLPHASGGLPVPCTCHEDE